MGYWSNRRQLKRLQAVGRRQARRARVDRRRRMMRRIPVGDWRLWMAGVALGAVILPPVVDVVMGLVKPRSGCRVIGVVDGDTLRMSCPGSDVTRGRILGIDTPEVSAACIGEAGKAWAATQYLRYRLWTGWRIEAPVSGLDRYGRGLVRLRIDGRGVENDMIELGLARAYGGGRRFGWCGDDR